MQTLLDDVEPESEPNATAADRPSGFWKRQFSRETTSKQKVFDWFFGVILPVICVAVDPIVFKGLGLRSEGPLLGSFKAFAYLLSFTSIIAMMARLIWREKLGGLNAVISGLFAFGGVISLGVGIILLPFSIIGLLVVIGVLGFTPLFSAFVYVRNSFRAFQQAAPLVESRVLVSTFFLAILFSGVIPFVVNVEIDRKMDNLVRGNAESIYADAGGLKYFAPLIDFSVVSRAYCVSQDKEKREALAYVYNRYDSAMGRLIDFQYCKRD